MSLLSQEHLQNEQAAYAWVEAQIWPDGPVCPHCGSVERIAKMQGKATRFGLYKCYACRKQFRVTVGTIFEKSHIPLHLWLQAFYLLASSKKGISSNQLHRTLGVTMKTAWFMSHRIREAMREGTRLSFAWKRKRLATKLQAPSSFQLPALPRMRRGRQPRPREMPPRQPVKRRPQRFV